MIAGAVAAGMPAAWVASDELYGDNGAFRAGVAKLGLGYVLAVSCDHRIPAFPGGKRRLRADQVAAPCRAAAGTGSAPGPAPRARAGMTGPGSACTSWAIAC
jgi:FOG: Transposase